MKVPFKKVITSGVLAGMMCVMALPTFAAPHQGRNRGRAPAPSRERGRPEPRRGAPQRYNNSHHDSHSSRGWAIGAGILGGVLLADAIVDAVTPRQTVVVTQPVVTRPVIVSQPTGYYQDREQRVWVDGRWVQTTDQFGRSCQVWQEGHFETRVTRVWISD